MPDNIRIAITFIDDRSRERICDLAEEVAMLTAKKIQVLYTWYHNAFFERLINPGSKTFDLNIIRPKLLLSKCIFCKQCAKNCPYSAIRFNKEKHNVSIDYQICMSCNECIKFCGKKAIAEHFIKIGTKYYAELNGVQYIGGISENEDAFYPSYIFKNIEKETILGSITLVPIFESDDVFLFEVLRKTDLLILNHSNDFALFSDFRVDYENEMLFGNYLNQDFQIPFLNIDKYNLKELGQIIVGLKG